MAEPKTISVAWPALPIGEPGWRTRLEDLATKAESLIGRDCSPQQTAELALEMCGVLWPVLGAADIVAGTCRASLLVGPPGVMLASPACDQLAEVSARLDAIWAAAQDDPSAALVEVRVPVLNDLRPAPAPRAKRQPRQPQPAELEPDAELAGVIEPAPAPAEDEDEDELPEAWRNCAAQQHCLEALEPTAPDPLPVVITPPAPAPARPLRPLAERLAPRPAPSPAAEPVRIPPPELPPHLQVIEPEPVAVRQPRPAPAPRRRTAQAPAPAPPGWFSAGEVAELVEVQPCSVARWRRDGHLGDEGTGWQRCGRAYYFAPAAVENIDRARIPGGLDQLVAEVQAS